MTVRLPRPLRFAVGPVLAAVLLTVGPVLMLRIVPAYTSSFMLQRAFEGRADPDFELRHHWVPLSRVSSDVALAVLASEDQRFVQHTGFDVRELSAAVRQRLAGGTLRGGSTLSQQVAKNLFLWPGRSLWRKGLEAYFTVLIEALWPKRRILEVYLNIAEWGDGLYGIDAAARRYFRRAPSAVSTAEAALLATALPNPKIYRVDRPDARMRRKQRWIQTQLPYLRAIGTATALGL